ncbi:MAG: ferrous iron transport protein B [Deltaproteobacteria bacterium]|nr:ferrous iron transport protein B [Deltaproteobacteria bacterium]MBW2051279.1 ferrous iron transport protein B [Deltaproteobacteria bacterium]MBW2139911.1 ferrous iron transport protein B [Deltaproteobacteria bacterium]MBW2322376.1 ferrous iron transport protein B [Deltaproteobacteria bacterium]
MAVKTLRNMRVGEKGNIAKIKAKGVMNRRLRDMGLVPGTEIEIQGRAPLYDPVNIKVRGNNLSLRNNEADYIHVDVGERKKPDTLKIVLAGNPNAGKSSLFNQLTGARAHVGNFPGITVAKKVGVITRNHQKIHVIDLPGTYSLTAYSPEELVARNYILDERPDLVVGVIDAANLERNLYLGLQLMEIGVPLVLALNMIDVAEHRGLKIDHEKLSRLLGIQVIPTVARTNKGIEKLMQVAFEIAEKNETWKPYNISYGPDLDKKIEEIAALFFEGNFQTDKYPPRWLAIKALEGDSQILKLVHSDNQVGPEIIKKVTEVSQHIRATLDDEPEGVIADYRYGFITSLTKQTVTSVLQTRRTISDTTDKVILNRLMGPVILFLVIYLIYQLVFWISEAPVTWLEYFFDWLGRTVQTFFPPGLLQSLIVSGIIDGVGGVLGFVPLIFCMFFAIALLEDSGYLARMAFILDRVLRAFGLHGNSVLALIISGGISGGCAVPGVMAARTLRDPKERLATILVTPLMNCGAKIPVYAMLIAAFFVKYEAQMMFLLTLIAWTFALLAARILRWTVLKGEHTPFVMELPPYRLPTLNGLLIHTWERTWQYIKKAGTIILGISILIWAMMTFPGLPSNKVQEFNEQKTQATDQFLSRADTGIINTAQSLDKFSAFYNSFKNNETKAIRNGEPSFQILARTVSMLEKGESVPENLKNNEPTAKAFKTWSQSMKDFETERAKEKIKHSLAGRFGTGLEVLTKPLGFDWRINIALVGGTAAKEIVLSTLGTVFSLGEVDVEAAEPLSKKLAKTPGWNPLVGFTLILFVMIYAPCFATLVIIGRETRSLRWPAFALVYTTLMAYVICLAVAQIGRALGLGT